MLQIDAILEVKFNYSTQPREIERRFKGAVRQALGYAKRVDAPSAYVLYLVAWFPRPASGLPGSLRDPGWKYATPISDTLIEGSDSLDRAAHKSIGTRRLARCVGSRLSASIFQVAGEHHTVATARAGL